MTIGFLIGLKFSFSVSSSFCFNKETTYFAIGVELVSPGDSIPTKFIVFGDLSLISITKSWYPPSSFDASFGLIPAKFLIKSSLLICGNILPPSLISKSIIFCVAE